MVFSAPCSLQGRGAYREPARLQRLNAALGVVVDVEIEPLVGGRGGSLPNLAGIEWLLLVEDKMNFLHAKRVAGAEHGLGVVGIMHVFEHQNDVLVASAGDFFHALDSAFRGHGLF